MTILVIDWASYDQRETAAAKERREEEDLELQARCYALEHGWTIIEADQIHEAYAPIPIAPITVSSRTDILPLWEVGRRIGLAGSTCLSRAIRKGELTKERSPITGRAGVSLAAAEAWSAHRKQHPHRSLRLSERVR